MPLQQTLEIIRSRPDPRDEENAKFQIIAPILGDLGWNPARQEVLYEYEVGGKDGGWVDIALMGPRRSVALIEAKRPSTNLGQHVHQMLRYAFYEGVDICVLTTGLEWWLYLPREDGPPEERRFATLHVREYPVDQLAEDLEAFLARKHLLSGQAKKRAKQVLQARRYADAINAELPALWKSMLTEPDSDLVELVRQRMHENIELRPNRDQVAAVLLSSLPHVVPPSSVHRAMSAQESSEQGASLPPEARSSQKPNYPKPPTGFRLWGKHYTVSSEDADSPGIDLLMKVTEILHQRHGSDLLERLLDTRSSTKVPYASCNLNDRHKEVQDTGIYLYIYLNNAQACHRAIHIMKIMGHPSTDLEILYD